MRGATSLSFAAVTLLCACSSPAQPGPTSSIVTGKPITGRIVARVNGPPYVYLRLKTDDGAVWVAVPGDMASDGGTVTVKAGALVRHFRPPGLGREFDEVIFGTIGPGR
jgi:hypothetical protein